MAYEIKKEKDELNSQGGGGPTTITPGVSTATTPSVSTVGTAASSMGPRGGGGNTNSGNYVNLNKILETNRDIDYTPITKPIEAIGTTSKTGIKTARDKFDAEAGPDAYFNPSDQYVLDNAIMQGGNFIQGAQKLTDRKYTGPMKLDTSPFAEALKKYGSYTQNLGTESGLNSVLQEQNANSSFGERNFDAYVYGNNPNFKTAATNLRNDYNITQGMADEAIAWAPKRAAERMAQEQAIANRSKDFLTGWQKNVLKAVDDQAYRNNQTESGLTSQYNAIRSGQLANPYAQSYTLTAPEVDPLLNAGNTELVNTYANLKGYREVVDPSTGLIYNPGAFADRSNSANGDQINQYNNINAVLRALGSIGGGWAGGNLGWNGSAFDKAKAEADARLAALQAKYRAMNIAPPANLVDATKNGNIDGGNGSGDNWGGRGNDLGFDGPGFSGGMGGQEQGEGGFGEGLGEGQSSGNNAAWAKGGLISKSRYATGGLIPGYSNGGALGGLLEGMGTGQSDSIPAVVGDTGTPVRLSDGEYIIPAEAVANAGGGSTKAGARHFDSLVKDLYEVGSNGRKQMPDMDAKKLGRLFQGGKV